MKGLFQKDLLILYIQRRTLLIILILGVFLFVGENPGAVIAYLTVVAGMMALGNMSYDEMDNGYSYLFTLPTSRTDYVKEKYLFSAGWVLVCLAVSILVCTLAMMLKSEPWVIDTEEIFFTSVTILSFTLILLALEIPLRLKLGAEKSRIGLYLVFAVLAVFGMAVKKMSLLSLPSGVKEFFMENRYSLAGAAVGVSVLLFLLSFLCSTRIVTKMEY